MKIAAFAVIGAVISLILVGGWVGYSTRVRECPGTFFGALAIGAAAGIIASNYFF